MAREPGGTQSLERAVSLLKAFTEGRPELKASELTRMSGLGQSTVSRMLGTLESLGFVERDERSGLYRLGPELISMAGLALNETPLYREARQVAQNVACELGLGTNVAQLRDGAAFYLMDFEGRLAPRAYTLMGRRAPLHATALGKALLCERSRDELENLVPPDALERYTPYTLTDLDPLHEQLEQVRGRGYATEVEELAFGRGCVAAPIRDRSRSVVAALSISGPLSALDLGSRERELASAVIEAADQIAIALGYALARNRQLAL